MTVKKTKKREARVVVPIGLDPDLAEAVASTAAAVRLTRQETVRQALRRGLPSLRKLLGNEAA